VFGVREDSGLCLQKWPVQGVASSPPFNLIGSSHPVAGRLAAGVFSGKIPAPINFGSH